MDYFRRFTFLFAAPVFDTDDLEGLRFNQIITEIERSGFEVVRARKLEDAGYIACTKSFAGRLPKTEFRLSSAGRRALEKYLDHMEALIRATREG